MFCIINIRSSNKNYDRQSSTLSFGSFQYVRRPSTIGSTSTLDFAADAVPQNCVEALVMGMCDLQKQVWRISWSLNINDDDADDHQSNCIQYANNVLEKDNAVKNRSSVIRKGTIEEFLESEQACWIWNENDKK